MTKYLNKSNELNTSTLLHLNFSFQIYLVPPKLITTLKYTKKVFI